jgi:hypothetical protein
MNDSPSLLDEEDEEDTKILAILRTICATFTLTVKFEGGGDSGQIDEIAVGGLLTEEQLKDMPVPDGWPRECSPQYAGSGAGQEYGNFYEAIEEWAYALIDRAVDFDWINNDGGRGTVTIEPFSGKIFIDAVRYEEEYIKNEHPEQYDLSVTVPDQVTEPANG